MKKRKENQSGITMRIEMSVIESLGLKSKKFKEYKLEIEGRYKNVKQHLLNPVQKSFIKRLYLAQPNKTAWFESICYVLLNKPLSSLKDSEEALLIDRLRFMFNALTKFIDISEVFVEDEKNEIYRFDLVSTKGTMSPKAFVLPMKQKENVDRLEKIILKTLSGDENVDVCEIGRAHV